MSNYIRACFPALAILALAFRLASPVSAQSVPLTLENIFLKDRGASQAAISPDGMWVAVTVAENNASNIYLVSTKDGPAPSLWVKGSSPSWAPDSRSIVFLADGDFWAVALHESNRRRITNDSQSKRAPIFSPDGKWIAFYSDRSSYQDIWLVSADGSTPPRKLTHQANAADDVRFEPAWSPDQKEVAYISDKGNYWHDDVWVVDVASGAERQLSGGFMASSTPVWSPDGKQIAVMGISREGFWYQDMEDIYLLDPRIAQEHKLKMQIHATDWLMSMKPSWSGDGQRIYFPYQQKGDFDLWSAPSRGGVATQMTYVGGAFGSLTTSKGAVSFTFVRSTPNEGRDVYYLTAEAGPARRLTRFATAYEGLRLPVEVGYRSYDGLYMQGFLYLPSDLEPGKRYPALVQVHGGGTNAYLHGESLIEQYLASKGYVVMAINYRGSSGFGHAFQDLSANDWGNGQALDAGAAADFLRTLPYVDGKVGIYGYSYGGIMTMAAITRTPDKFDAAVPMAGIYDFADAYSTADRVGKIFLMTGHSGSPEEHPEHYERSNALSRIQNIRCPVLIMHGEADVRAPFRQFGLAVKKLQEYGKDFQSKTYPGEPHGFRNVQDRLDLYRRLEAFFDEHLKGSSQKAGRAAVSGTDR